jgi:hypothetical protein
VALTWVQCYKISVLEDYFKMARAATHNAGRPHGAAGKLPARRRQAALATIERLDRQRKTPLDVILAVMDRGFGPQEQGGSGYERAQFDAAVAAAPFIHPKLTAIAYTPPPDEEAARRREMLAKLTYDERKQLQAILERARARANGQIEASVD